MHELQQKIGELIETKLVAELEKHGQQKFQEGFRAGTGCPAECMAVVRRAEEYIRNYDQLSYEFLRSAVLDLMSARDFER